jgi:hypothetical protein
MAAGRLLSRIFSPLHTPDKHDDEKKLNENVSTFCLATLTKSPMPFFYYLSFPSPPQLQNRKSKNDKEKNYINTPKGI